MMTPRHTITKFEALDLMLESCIKDHSSHERRNEHMTAVRYILDNWARGFRSYQDEYDREAKALATIEAIYELCIWQLDHETHTDVKTRLFMARNLIKRFLANRDKAIRDGIDRRSRQIIASRRDEQDPFESMDVSKPDDKEEFDAEVYSNKDISEDLGLDHDSSAEGPGENWWTQP